MVHWYALQFRWIPHQAPQDVTVEHYNRKLPVSLLLWHAAFRTLLGKSWRPGSHHQGWSFAQNPCQFETSLYFLLEVFSPLCNLRVHTVWSERDFSGAIKKQELRWKLIAHTITCIGRFYSGKTFDFYAQVLRTFWSHLVFAPNFTSLDHEWIIQHPHFFHPNSMYFFKLYIWSYVLLVRSKDNSRMLFSVFTVGDWLGTCCTFLELRTYSLCCFVDAVLGTDGLVCFIPDRSGLKPFAKLA